MNIYEHILYIII